MYLRIENSGVADVSSFYLLGASSAREDATKIGQFGSGAKHALLILLRLGIECVVCCGRTRIKPFTRPVVSNNVAVQQVWLEVNGQKKETSMTTDFGSLDWTKLDMALREIVTNALDQSDDDWSQISIETCENIRAKQGTTRVFVEATREVLEYVASIRQSFLHASSRQREGVLAKPKQDTVRFFNRGVFVREGNDTSLFDYNSVDGVEIDESRNLDDYRLKSECAKILSNGEHQTELESVLRKLADGVHCLESDFSSWYLDRQNTVSAFHNVFGEDCYPTSSELVAVKIRAKGYNAVSLPSGWIETVVGGFGEDRISAAETLLSAAEKRDDIEPLAGELPQDFRETAQRVWEVLTLAGQTRNRDFPVLKLYRNTMRDNAKTWGFFDRSTNEVWIEETHKTNTKTIMEEFAHYLSGFSDETRDFQDWILETFDRLILRD